MPTFEARKHISPHNGVLTFRVYQDNREVGHSHGSIEEATAEARKLERELQNREGHCPGCGQTFNGKKGLRAHQTTRFGAMGCKPTTTPTTT